ncbi:MAG: LysE family transporter [Pseudomonadota bacterium]
MSDLALFLPGILLAHTVSAVGLLSPGPNILAVMGTSMSCGRKSGLALALGVAFGSFCWAVLTAVGLSALIAAYSWALIVIKTAGGCYLLWLAFKAFRSAATPGKTDPEPVSGRKTEPRAFFVRGLIIQATNPKAALTWIAIISLGLQDGAPVWVAMVIVIGTSVLSVVAHCLYALAFSTEVAISLYGRARRWIQGLLGAFFALAGLKMLTSRN